MDTPRALSLTDSNTCQHPVVAGVEQNGCAVRVGYKETSATRRFCMDYDAFSST